MPFPPPMVWIQRLRATWSQGDNAFQNDFEREFCELRLRQHGLAIARTLALVSIFYHLSSLGTDRFIVAKADRSLFAAIHLTFLGLHGLWWVLLRRLKVDLQAYLWILQLVFIGFMGYVITRTLDRGVTTDVMLSTSGFIATSAAMVLMCPFANRMLAITAGIYATIGAVAVSRVNDGPRWVAIAAFVLGVMMASQVIAARRTKMRALQDYRTMIRVAPRLVVQQALSTAESVEAAFHPQIRPVACVSSDWRNYQSFSSSQEPQVVANALAAYYALCNDILRAVAPQGNYYSDWIADELFVVFYGRPGEENKGLAMQALEFSCELLKAKETFLLTNKMPAAIDLGISVGSAYVGMMGPKDHSKATALGETPGLSRRLQGAGKLLRQRLGEVDRVIVDVTTALMLGGQYNFFTYGLAPNERLRDLNAVAISYLALSEPAPLRTSDPPPPTLRRVA